MEYRAIIKEEKIVAIKCGDKLTNLSGILGKDDYCSIKPISEVLYRRLKRRQPVSISQQSDGSLDHID